MSPDDESFATPSTAFPEPDPRRDAGHEPYSLRTAADSAHVAPGAVAWLLLTRVGVQEGPGGGDKLTSTTFIQRVNIAGGVAPSTGCASSSDVGREAFMPYTADYIFYEATDGHERR